MNTNYALKAETGTDSKGKADEENYVYDVSLSNLGIPSIRLIMVIIGVILLVGGFLVIIFEVYAARREVMDYLVAQHLLNIGLGVGIQILGIGALVIAKK